MQISQVQFRKLVLVYGVSTVGYYVISFLPGGLTDIPQNASMPFWLFGFASLFLMGWTLYNAMALYRFVPSAQLHLCIITVANLLLYAAICIVAPDELNAAIESLSLISLTTQAVFADISVIMSGALIALAYFSPVAAAFKKSRE